METSKYIIKNCSCYDYGFCTSKTIYVAGCSQCTDCVLKQIVELCKEDWEDMTVSKFQSELLDKLDIQEAE